MATDAVALPFPKRLKLYLDERFPLTTHLVVVFAFFFSNYFLAERLLHTGPATLGPRALAGMVAVLLTFFLLRIFDEFKDYDRDVIAHPDRIVSRGIMPLAELRTMGWVVVGILAACNLFLGWQVFATYLAVITFALLMYKEFFVGEWLSKHVMLYALTHQVITPLLCLFVYAIAAFQASGAWHAPFWLQLAMGAGTGLGWEMSRKVRMPDDEHPQIDTYSKHFGPMVASMMAFAILVSGAACASYAGLLAGFPAYAFGLLGLGLLVATVGFVRFWLKPTSKGAKGLDNWAAVLMLLCYIAIAVGSVGSDGVRFVV